MKWDPPLLEKIIEDSILEARIESVARSNKVKV